MAGIIVDALVVSAYSVFWDTSARLVGIVTVAMGISGVCFGVFREGEKTAVLHRRQSDLIQILRILRQRHDSCLP